MVARTRRAGPHQAPPSSRDAGKRTNQGQHATGPAAAGTLQSAYAWAAAARRPSLLLDLQDAWLTSVTGRAA